MTIKTGNDRYEIEKIKKTIGDTYTVVLWHAPEVDMSSVKIGENSDIHNVTASAESWATAVSIPVEPATVDGISIQCIFSYRAR